MVIGTLLQTTVSALAAYALARKKFRGGAIISLTILSTMMLPDEVISIPLYLILQKDIPIIDASLYNSYAGLILPIVGWAFSIFLLTEFMKAIPVTWKMLPVWMVPVNYKFSRMWCCH